MARFGSRKPADYTAELQHNALFQRRTTGGTAAGQASRQQRLEIVTRALDFLETAGKINSATPLLQQPDACCCCCDLTPSSTSQSAR
jgi:hypothetical protein